MKRAYDFSPRINMLQFRVLFARYLKQTVSNPWVIIPMFLQAPVLLLISSFVYEDGTFYEQWAHPTSANCMPFLLVLSAALMGLLNSYREICKEREILRREVFGGLDVTAYVGSKVTVQAIAGGVQSIIVAFGSLTFIDYNMARPGYSLFFLLAAVFLTNYAMTAVGLLVSALLKKSESAILPIIVIIILQVVFAGALIEFEMPVKVIYYFTPTMYGTSVVGNVMGLETRLVYENNIYFCLAMLIVIATVCHLLTVIKLKRDYRTRD